jgi:hypothetical protein
MVSEVSKANLDKCQRLVIVVVSYFARRDGAPWGRVVWQGSCGDGRLARPGGAKLRSAFGGRNAGTLAPRSCVRFGTFQAGFNLSPASFPCTTIVS